MTLGSFAPVSRDRETVRFIAHALDQVQCPRVRGQYSGRIAAQQEQLLLARPPVGTLGDADQGNPSDPQFSEHLRRFRELAFAAVDEQYVGRGNFAVAHALVTPRQRPMHGGVVVAGLDAADVEAAIVALERTLLAEYHARGDRIRAARVADVEALDAVRRLLQIEGLAQIFQAGLDAGARQSAHGQRLFRIVVHHLQPARANAADLRRNAHLVTRALRQGRLEQR